MNINIKKINSQFYIQSILINNKKYKNYQFNHIYNIINDYLNLYICINCYNHSHLLFNEYNNYFYNESYKFINKIEKCSDCNFLYCCFCDEHNDRFTADRDFVCDICKQYICYKCSVKCNDCFSLICLKHKDQYINCNICKLIIGENCAIKCYQCNTLTCDDCSSKSTGNLCRKCEYQNINKS